MLSVPVFFLNLNDMSLVCEDLTQARGIYMPNYCYIVLQKYTTYNGLREHFPEKSDHEGMDHTPPLSCQQLAMLNSRVDVLG